MPYLYVLYSEKDQKFYIGQTERDIQIRFHEHISGYVKSTKARRPLVLTYSEQYKDPQEAKKREWHLKQPSGFLQKKALLHYIIASKMDWPISVEGCGAEGRPLGS